jgi:hypothetical protein
MSEDESRKLENEEAADEVEGHARPRANEEPAQEGESSDDDVEGHVSRKL